MWQEYVDQGAKVHVGIQVGVKGSDSLNHNHTVHGAIPGLSSLHLMWIIGQSMRIAILVHCSLWGISVHLKRLQVIGILEYWCRDYLHLDALECSLVLYSPEERSFLAGEVGEWHCNFHKLKEAYRAQKTMDTMCISWPLYLCNSLHLTLTDVTNPKNLKSLTAILHFSGLNCGPTLCNRIRVAKMLLQVVWKYHIIKVCSCMVTNHRWRYRIDSLLDNLWCSL